MKPLALMSLTLLFITLSTSTFADDAANCKAAGGTSATGQVVSTAQVQERYVPVKGVELSHTHLSLKGTDGKTYDVAIDNVFASGYQKNKKGVPAPLNTVEVGDKLELCGIPFSGGIHWVHNNCGGYTPTKSDPNGWIKKVSADGSVEQNLEASQKYCYLWPHHETHI